jgi:hypothetical protein
VRERSRYGLAFLLVAIGLATQAAALGAACHPPAKCPTCAPAPPPQIVTHRERCMDAKPELPLVQLPAPNDAGLVTLDRAQLAGLLQVLALLRAYVDTQYDRCGQEVPDAGP